MKTMLVSLVLLCCSANQLLASAPYNPSDPNMDQVEQFVEMMQKYVTLADDWVATVRETEGAAFFALESIVEIYKMQGDKLGAIPALRKYADDSRQHELVRRIAMFKVMEIYKESGKLEEALRELDKIINSLK